MANATDSSSKLCLPSSSTFSFTSPLSMMGPPSTPQMLKQRRVSMALTSSPRLVPAWSFRDDSGLNAPPKSMDGDAVEKKGKMRRITLDGDESLEGIIHTGEKRQRKKWTEEETQMLVDGCNTWGVGNWKAILNDPTLRFDNRSPVDLKDRFRTFFPDAYKLHYPNAKTHLSSKVRSTLPDGTSLFEKTRSKKRRPFTAEEDRALRAGYEKHGTVWSIIVKDPIFQEQNRRSTDLRDRFRNAFPQLYQAAGYKPRTVPKKKRLDDHRSIPMHTTMDDQALPSRTKSSSRQRSRTLPGHSRSVPQSTACSEDEDSSGGEEEFLAPARPATFISPEQVPLPPDDTPNMSDISLAAEVSMQSGDPSPDPLGMSDMSGSSLQSVVDMDDPSQNLNGWFSGRQSPNPFPFENWSTATTTSPTSSHISGMDYLMNESPTRQSQMIGKSAWDSSDWLSAHPRMDPSAVSSSSSSFVGGPSPTPSSPFSFSNLSHGIMDRYDLSLTSFAHDFASEVGFGDTHSTFSDPDMFPTQSFRGFTHHSNYAGDLIFGARTHQPSGNQMNFGSDSSGFGFGDSGLGLSGISQAAAGLNAMQIHTPALLGIDDLELASIRLDDQVEHDDMMVTTHEMGVQVDGNDGALFGSASDLRDLSALIELPMPTLEETLSLASVDPQEQDPASTPPATPYLSSRASRSPYVHQSQAPAQFTFPPNRSSSVPATEHRSTPPARTAQLSSHHQPFQGMPPRSMSLYDFTLQMTNGHGMGNTSAPRVQAMPAPALQAQAPSPTATAPASTAGFADNLKAPGEFYDLPFLDMHYFTGPGSLLNHSIMESHAEESRPGQALDLAQLSGPSTSQPLAPVTGMTPSSVFQIMSSAATRPTTGIHQRMQSAVSPKDLLLRNGSDHKRKRTISYDGSGH